MDKERLTYQGINRTIARWAFQLDIPEATIRRRLKQGCTVEEALARKPEGEKMLNYRCKIQSIGDWAKELGLTPKIIEERLAKGLPLAKVLLPKNESLAAPSDPEERHIAYRGRSLTVEEWANELGVSPKKVAKHMAEGTTHLLPFIPFRRHMLTYKGRTMSPNGWARQLGISSQAIYQRIARGCPLEEVLAPKYSHYEKKKAAAKKTTAKKAVAKKATKKGTKKAAAKR